MSIRRLTRRKYLLLGLLPLVLAGCDKFGAVSYSKDVRPILDQACMQCHKIGGKGQVKSGLSMESYEEFMKGTKFGPMIIPGDSLTSSLVILIEGRADPGINMPQGDHSPLNAEQIAVIRKWIDQGAKNN
jgi:hypothetical protein